MKKNSTSQQSPKRAAAWSDGPITIGMDLGDRTSRYCVLGGGNNAKKRAVVAVARKLAVLLHRLWVCGEVYQPLRHSRFAANTQQASLAVS